MSRRPLATAERVRKMGPPRGGRGARAGKEEVREMMDGTEEVEQTLRIEHDAIVEARRFLARVKPRTLKIIGGGETTTTALNESLFVRSVILAPAVVNTRPKTIRCKDCRTVVNVGKKGLVPIRCKKCKKSMKRTCFKCAASIGLRAKTGMCRKHATARSMAARTPEQRSESVRKANSVRTPEQRSDLARRNAATKTHEQRSESARRGAHTRYAGKAKGSK